MAEYVITYTLIELEKQDKGPNYWTRKGGILEKALEDVNAKIIAGNPQSLVQVQFDGKRDSLRRQLDSRGFDVSKVVIDEASKFTTDL